MQKLKEQFNIWFLSFKPFYHEQVSLMKIIPQICLKVNLIVNFGVHFTLQRHF